MVAYCCVGKESRYRDEYVTEISVDDTQHLILLNVNYVSCDNLTNGDHNHVLFCIIVPLPAS